MSVVRHVEINASGLQIIGCREGGMPAPVKAVPGAAVIQPTGEFSAGMAKHMRARHTFIV